MSKLDDVQASLGNYFNHISGPNYVRIMDTPHVWGLPFGQEIMPQALARQAEFERAIEEIVQKARYRCDLSSLNSPDPDWVKVVLGAMDTALTNKMGRTTPTQFRFLFGQTPMSPFTEPANFTDFKAALVRLIRLRSSYWETMPEIWMGRFYRLEAGILSALKSRVFGDSAISSDDTKMTWNHSKIISVDGTEALVGGHNLNMDLFRSYPPVHDVSVVVHGAAAYSAQLYLNRMWDCGIDLFTKEKLNTKTLHWENGDSNRSLPADPLQQPTVTAYMKARQDALLAMHRAGVQTTPPDEPPATPPREVPQDIRSQDLQTLEDLKLEVFQERIIYNQYDQFDRYKMSTAMLAVGKYWTGPNIETDYQKGSEIMKETLIKSAKRMIRMSQMDLISAWKKNWSDHVVCQWLMQALLANPALKAQVVVSPLDAGAGAEGDQYSFGSGASRTYELIKYYMTHDVDTDAKLTDKLAERADALSRLSIAPFFYTDAVRDDQSLEGETYKWPNLSKEGYTATLKQPSLESKPPRKGVIGSAALSVLSASGYIYNKVPSAPGNHAKIMIVDDELYVVGSDNLYPGSLSEFNYLIEGDEAVNDLLTSYWQPLWQYSRPHVYGPKRPEAAYESNLSNPAYLYDLVVGTTATAINSTLKQFLSKNSSDPVEIWYGQEDAGSPIVPMAPIPGVDPFSIASDGTPSAALLDSTFVFAIKAQFGLPEGVMPDVLPDIVVLGTDSQKVTYNLFFNTFQIATLDWGRGGAYAWRNYSQPADSPYIFTFQVDMNFNAADPDSKFSSLPANVRDMLLQYNTSTMFSVQQLYLDLNNAGLQTMPQINGVPSNSPVYMKLQKDFVLKYWQSISQSGQFVLGYAVHANAGTPSRTSMQPTSLNFMVSPHYDDTGAISKNHQLYTLNYLMETENRKLTVGRAFSWNWINDNEQNVYHGAMAVRREVFANFLIAAISPYLASIAITPTTTYRQSNAGFTWSAGYSLARTPNQTFSYVSTPGSRVADYGFNASSHHSDTSGLISGHYNLDSAASASIDIAGNEITITLSASMNIDFSNGDLGTADISGLVGGYSNTIVLLVTINDDGSISVADKPGYPTPKAIPANLSSGFMAGVDGVSGLADSLTSHYTTMTDYMKTFAAQVETYLNNSGTKWIFPGGQTFVFKKVGFSGNQDLVAHLVYVEPQ